MTTAELLPSLKNVRKTATGWTATCPGHDDRNPSLSVAAGTDGRVLMHCHAGCQPEKVLGALGLGMPDLFVECDGGDTPRRFIVATYDYRDETGEVLYQVVRFDPKDFRQRRPDHDKPGEWLWNMQGVRRVLFRLPELLNDLDRGLPVLVVEGEKDVLALTRLGFTATCNVGGAGKWSDDYTETLRGADVIVIADKDEPGRDHAAKVCQSLLGAARSVRILELPDHSARQVKDVSDFLVGGGTPQDLTDLIDSCPSWEAPPVEIRPERSNDSAVIRGQIIEILNDKELTGTQKRTEIARAVVAALENRGQFFFHAELRDFDSAMFFDRPRRKLERIRSDAFQAWLSDWLRVNRADTLFHYAVSEVESAALAWRNSQGIVPEAFWASRPGILYLSNGDGQVIRIAPGEVTLVDNGTDGVLFAAGRTLRPWKLTAPADPFETCSLFRGAQYAAEHGLDLQRLWTLSLPTNPRSKPPMCNAGDIGSGKTRTAKGIAELYGIPAVIAKVDDHSEADFWPVLDQGGLYVLDNADTKIKWLPDALANAATDGCSRKRRLYSNADTVTLRARGWVLLTTSNPTFASDAGLSDRLLIVRMGRRTGQTSDSELSDEIAANRDAGLSFVAHTLAKALADNQPVPPDLNARHPDFAAFAVRIGRAIGREQAAVQALSRAEADKAAFCLENDLVGLSLLTLIRMEGQFNGSATELLSRLREIDSDFQQFTAKKLGKRLKSIWPHLESVLKSEKETDRKGIMFYRFAGFAGFDPPIFDKAL